MSRKYWIILVVLVALWGSWYFVARHQIDKQKFEKIEEAVATLTQSIAEEFDLEILPTKNYCRISEGKYSDGPLYCYVSAILVRDQLNDKDSSVINYTDSDDLTGSILRKDNSTLAFQFKNIPEASCRLSSLENSEIAMFATEKPFNYEVWGAHWALQCLDNATRAHYELLVNN
jgi:hypothetical protein